MGTTAPENSESGALRLRSPLVQVKNLEDISSTTTTCRCNKYKTKEMCRTDRCHSAREDLLLTMSMCTNKPILDKTISALGVGAEPHRQAPGLCLSICPLCSYSDASGDSISLATVGSATAAATRSPMVRAPLHCFSSISETREFYAGCCRFERMYVPMRLNQFKRSRRVGVEGWKCAWQEARSKRARPALWPLHHQTFDEGCASSSTLSIDHTTSIRIKRHQTPPLPWNAIVLVISTLFCFCNSTL